MPAEVRVAIDRAADIVTARQQGRDLALQIGFLGTDLTLIATAISEVSRNIVSYATSGEIILHGAEEPTRRGIVVIARDDGPGIPSIADALREGYSTGSSLGLGLPGARRLMDDFEIVSCLGQGTTITMRKWIRR
jgi:serine/threonine-protein kinase RsbT